MTNKEIQAPEEKRSKPRSRLYPRYDLEECIQFVSALSKLGGENVSLAALGAAVGKATNNSTFIGRVSSSKQFGLIGQNENKVSLSALAKRILFPREENEKKSALLESFAMPPLYRELIEAFHGKTLPEVSTLGNRLHHDYNIEAVAKDKAAHNFLQSANFVGAVRNGLLLPEIERDGAVVKDEQTSSVVMRKDEAAGIRKESEFEFEFAGGIKLSIPRNKKTSELIADGELKKVREALSEFAQKIGSTESQPLDKLEFGTEKEMLTR